MIIISSGEGLRNLDFPRNDNDAKRICDRFEKHEIPYIVEFY